MEKQDLRQLLELSITSGRQGAKAAEVSLIRSVVSALVERLPITVEPTQTVPTTDNPSDVEEHMFQPTRVYSQWDPVDTKNGPVELHSACAHVHRRMLYLNEAEDNPYRTLFAWEWCPISAEPVLKSSVRTPAQAVAPASSTSVKQPLNESVENSVEESAKSQLKEWIDSISGLKDFEAKTDKDKGYQEGIVTAQAWMEMKLRSK